MSQEDPKNIPSVEAPVQPEQEAVSYEHVLELAKALKEAKVRDPYAENEKTDAFRDALTLWRSNNDLIRPAIENLNRAALFVKEVKIFLEAGFSGKNILAAAREKLEELHHGALQEGNQEVIEYLERELDTAQPKHRMEGEIRQKLLHIALMEKPIDRVGAYATLLFDPRFMRMPLEERKQIEQLRDQAKVEWQAAKKSQA